MDISIIMTKDFTHHLPVRPLGVRICTPAARVQRLGQWPKALGGFGVEGFGTGPAEVFFVTSAESVA